MGACVTKVSELSRTSDWTDCNVTVAGIGDAGYAAADALMQLGAVVTVIDSVQGERQSERGRILDALGVTVLLGHDEVPNPIDLLVISPAYQRDGRTVQDAIAREIPIWGEIELAWRLRDPDSPAAWLCVAGAHGSSTTTLMLESMLRVAGYRTKAAGSIGESLVDVVMHDDLDVIAVELSVAQLEFVESVSPVASVCLNAAGPDPMEIAALSRVYENTQEAVIYNVQDPETLRMVESADVVEGCRAIGFTLGTPGLSMLGVVDDLLVDRAFVEDRISSAQELATASNVHPFAPHNVANALAAAALARAFGVPPSAVREGLVAFVPVEHRMALVGTAGGVNFVDDSKAANAHEARMSLLTYDSVVWIAGRSTPSPEFDDLIRAVSDHLSGVILVGSGESDIAQALARHAPDVPVIEVVSLDTGAMVEVLGRAAALARPGDTVLLSPACPVAGVFGGYRDLGQSFAKAVHALPGFRAAASGDRDG